MGAVARVAADLANEPGVQEFAGQLVGSPAQEAGELLTDHIRFRRFKTELKILTKAKAELEKAGIESRQVDLKVLAPLIEYSSLESEESLADKWAALLANAATAEECVPPASPTSFASSRPAKPVCSTRSTT